MDWPRAVHAAWSASTALMTHCVMLLMSADSSTCGMKLPGGTKPRCGCAQRRSASVLETLPVASENLA